MSCTGGPLGTYSLSFTTRLDARDIALSYLTPRLSQMASRLNDCVPPQRVFSTFGPEMVIREFMRIWSTLTEPTPMSTDYYPAHLSFRTRETLTTSAPPPDHVPEIRIAEMTRSAPQSCAKNLPATPPSH